MEDKKNPNIDYSQNAQTEPNVEEIPFDQLPKKEQRRRIKETKKKAKYDKKVKKALNAQKGRGLKNFIWWLVGFLSSFIIAASAIFVCVKLVPLKTFLGENSDEVATEEVTSKSLVDIFMAMDEFKVSDVKILQNVLTDLLSSSGIDSIINIDMNKLGELQFVYPDGSGKDFGSEIQNCFKVSKELFGDLAKLPIFENTLVPTDKIPDANVDSNFAPQIYYYLESGDISDDTAVLKPAYNADKTRVEESIGKDIYYVSLDAIPFGDMMDSISARLAPVKLSSMLDAFSEGASSSLIGKVLGDTTVSGLSTFNTNGILLNDVMPYDKDNADVKELYDLLLQSVVREGDDAEEVKIDNLTLGDLAGVSGKIDFEKIKVSKFIKNNTDNESLYKILLDLTGKTAAEDITLGDLNGLDISTLELVNILDKDDYSNLYSILTDATGKTADEITLAQLKSFNIDSILLTTVLPKEDNENLYKILMDATGVEDSSNLTISSLSDFEIGDVRLHSVIESSTDPILGAVLAKDTEENPLTVSNLGDALHNLEITEVFTDIVIFEKVEGTTTKARYTFNEGDGSYTLEASGEYQISDQAKFWLFVMYDCEGVEEGTGNGTKYTDNHLTVEGLEYGVNVMSTAIIKATMRQLKDAGVITGTYKDSVLSMSLKEVLDTLNEYMSG